MTVYLDEELNSKARQWVRENACVKGRPNMTAQSFCQYANNNLLQSSHLPPYFPQQISIATATRWLHHLGFKPRDHKKGVYTDGHEHEDLIQYRQEYIKTMETLRKSHQLPSQVLMSIQESDVKEMTATRSW